MLITDMDKRILGNLGH